MKKIISLLVLIIILVILSIVLLKKSKDQFSFRPIQRQLPDLSGSVIRPVRGITITGSRQNATLTMSVSPEGKISFINNISFITDKNIRREGDRKIFEVKNNEAGQKVRVSKTYYYTEDSKFFIQTIIKQGNGPAITKKKCYDLSRGPLPIPHIVVYNDLIRENDFTFNDLYGDDDGVYLRTSDRFFADRVNELKRTYGNDTLLVNRLDYLNTPFFSIFGKLDRLYKPDGSINQKFLGMSNIRVSPYRLLPAPFRIEGVICESEATKIYREEKDGKLVEREVKFPFPEFKQKRIFIPDYEEYGYDMSQVGGDRTILLLDPVQGINFDRLRQQFENVPDINDMMNRYNPRNLGERLPNPITSGINNYYPVKNPNLLFGEIGGVVKGPSKPTIDLASQMEKKYKLCRAQVNSIVQPYNDNGNACPDSQDIALSLYSYYPATGCDWAKVGDAWCSHEIMADDKLLICEWGKLYHGTSDVHVKAIMFVFSGSDDMSDWMSDFTIWSTSVSRLGDVHTGFYDEFLKWFPKMMRYLKAEPLDPNRRELPGSDPSFLVKYKTPYKKIIVGGHSLGGAQAQIAAAYFRQLFPENGPNAVDIEIFSQGAPFPFQAGGIPDSIRRIPHRLRLKNYWYDECFIPFPPEEDPVVDILCCGWLGSYCHTSSVQPIRKYISREASWDLFSGGWWGCDYAGTKFDKRANSVDNWLSYLPGGSIAELLINLLEHPTMRYFEKSSVLCPKNSVNPNTGDTLQIVCDYYRALYDIETNVAMKNWLLSQINIMNCPPSSI